MAVPDETARNACASHGAAAFEALKSHASTLVAVAAMVGILALPTPVDLPIAGHRILAIVVFAIIIWATDAINYALSALIIALLMTFLLGFAPKADNPAVTMGTGPALNLAFSGLGNVNVVFVAAAACLMVAIKESGLNTRIAIMLLARIGVNTRRVTIAMIVIGIAAAFIIPSPSVRVACLAPVVLGISAVFGLSHRSAIAAMLMIVTVQTANIWGLGISSASPGNQTAIAAIEDIFDRRIGWFDWLLAAAPFAVCLSAGLYLVVTRMIPAEVADAPGGVASVRHSLETLDPMTVAEKKVAAVLVCLIVAWTAGQVLGIDSATAAVIAAVLIVVPRFGVLTWNELQLGMPWGVILLLGVGFSLGTALVQTHAAYWVATYVVVETGLAAFPPAGILVLMSAFLLVVHLGFSSSVGLTSVMIPIVITVLTDMSKQNLNAAGLTMLLQFSANFAFILVVSGPQNMIAYSTGAFDAKDFIRTGAVLSAIALALVALFGATYWRWLGYV